MKTIKEHDVGQHIKTKAYIQHAARNVAKNQKPYLSLTFADTSGNIEGKLWNVTDTQVKLLTVGTVVEFEGVISYYGDRLQVNLSEVHPATGDIQDLLPASPVDIKPIRDYIEAVVDNMQHDTLQRIVKHFLTKYEDAFYTYPAAKRIHHAYRGGLAHHVEGMLRMAKTMCDLHPDVHADLLYTAVIIHDIGKTIELTDAFTPEYSLEGTLIGHISLIQNEFHELRKWFPNGDGPRTLLLLQHMVLSHHGRLEWGSPVTPGILEAQILHQLDTLDANVNAIENALAETDEDAYTANLFALDNKKFYKHGLSRH